MSAEPTHSIPGVCVCGARRGDASGNHFQVGKWRGIIDLVFNCGNESDATGKHLRVLEGAGIVRSVRVGRETQFTLQQKPIDDAREYLEHVSQRWDSTLARLKSRVED